MKQGSITRQADPSAEELCRKGSTACDSDDYATAVELFRKAAEQGHAEAQCYLGECYYFGKGITQDYTKAAEWYRKSAEQGYAYAQFNVGGCYDEGQGIAQDRAKAVECGISKPQSRDKPERSICWEFVMKRNWTPPGTP